MKHHANTQRKETPDGPPYKERKSDFPDDRDIPADQQQRCRCGHKFANRIAVIPVTQHPVAHLFTAEKCLRLDLGDRRTEGGGLPLKTIDRDVALAMIKNPRPLREKDKFFSFDIGSMVMGGQLANRSTEYTYGESIIAQCNINPPHEDLWVEVAIEDSEQRIIDSAGQYVTRDSLWANFKYQAGSRMLPGDYSLVLKSGGKEIARRHFKLTGDPESQPASMPMLTN